MKKGFENHDTEYEPDMKYLEPVGDMRSEGKYLKDPKELYEFLRHSIVGLHGVGKILKV